MECKCDMRTKLVGDGCEACNPEKSLECAKQTIADLEEENEKLRKALQRAAAWGISSRAFDAHTACELEDWVKGGMDDELPPLAYGLSDGIEG